MALETGTVVGAYYIEPVLGHGRMVYRALDSRLNRAVAVKFAARCPTGIGRLARPFAVITRV